MEMKPGAKLGSYEIVSAIGKGGMGEVWKAHDPQLGRDVAIKVSAQQFSDRFEREARAIAALNHPNVCTLYHIGPNYLVMEYIEGPTLTERIKEGPIPPEEALGLAKQIADALEAAHEKGIVHRDLKPENIRIKPDGSVKVLDFGLAKSATQPAVTSDSPTMLSAAGMILGTAGYMSPEQARGQEVDKRADIFAFGVVLYELLTGERLFEGPTVTDTLAAMLTREPDYTKVPAKVRRLLRKCLEKDPKKRLRDIGDWAELLDGEGPKTAPSRTQRVPWLSNVWAVATGASILALAGLGFVHFREKPPDDRVMRFTLSLPGNVTLQPFFALSPDGRQVAVQRLTEGKQGLWVRPVDSSDFRYLSGTDLVRGVFWSPDSRYIGFFAGGKLKVVPANGGPPQTLCDAGIYAEGTWSRDGVILFDADSGALERTRVNTGTDTGSGECTTLLPAQNRARGGHASFLPDGKHFLYAVIGGDQSGIYLGTLDAPQGRRLLADASPVKFAPMSAGGRYDHILFLRDGSLMAQAFNATSLQLVGDAFPVALHGAANLNSGLAASAASGGLLIYLTGVSREKQLTWLDRSGKQIDKIGMPGDADAVAPSPDGKTVALIRQNSGLSLLDLNRNIESPFDAASPAVWSPDGSRIAMSVGFKEIHVKEANGGGKEQLLLKSDGTLIAPTDWSRDGRYLLLTKDDPKTHQDIWYLENPLGPTGDLKPKPFAQTEFREGRGQFSPDGRFVAYESEESGQREVFVRQFPSGSGKWKISSDGGGTPRWRSDGKELYYLGRPPSSLMAVPVHEGSDGSFQAGEPKKLFDLRVTQLSETFVYAPSADGQRFLVLLPAEDQAPTLNVITNWEKAAPQP